MKRELGNASKPIGDESGTRPGIPSFRLFLAAVLPVVAFRCWLLVNLPLDLRVQNPHDDTLFMRLGASIARGEWLGPFDQFTLMKGPGYPFFLALTAWSGLPVSLAHALIQGAAIIIAGWAVCRLTRSTLFAVVATVFLALDPAPFLDGSQLILREQIYWSLTLLASASFILCFLVPQTAAWSLCHALVFGLATGAAWLTREEGVLLLPPIGLALVGLLWLWWGRRRHLRLAAAGLAVAAVAFLVPHGAYMAANRLSYGSFVGVDIKEKGFVSALDALQSIDTGVEKPFVPVSLDALELASAVSPRAKPVLAQLFPDGPLFWWQSISCSVQPTSCGQIGGGWFMWALRDAAASQGFYKSPRAAAKGFRTMSGEIRAACGDGRLKCRTSLFSYLPHVSALQLAQVPRAVSEIVASITLSGVSAAPSEKRTLDGAALRYWSFLNYPFVNSRSAASMQTAHGWFFDPGAGEWPVLSILAGDGTEIESAVRRVPSPDLERAFGASAASHRFQIDFSCPSADCTLQAARPSKPSIRLVIPAGHAAARAGSATLNIDQVVSGAEVQADRDDRAPALAQTLRQRLAVLFSLASPLLFSLGLAAFLLAGVDTARRRAPTPLWLAALMLWGLAAVRTLALAMIHVTSFPSTGLSYSLPTLFWAATASFLSIHAACVALGIRWPAARAKNGAR